MKNTMKLISAAAVFSAVFIFSSCKKDGSSTGTTAETIITGNVYAELNTVMSGLETVPSGTTKLTALIDPNDLQANNEDTLKVDLYRYPVTVENGVYTVKVPARNKGTKVKFIGDDFIYNQVIDSDGNVVRKVYRLVGSPEITVYRGTTKVLDIVFQ